MASKHWLAILLHAFLPVTRESFNEHPYPNLAIVYHRTKVLLSCLPLKNCFLSL